MCKYLATVFGSIGVGGIVNRLPYREKYNMAAVGYYSFFERRFVYFMQVFR